MSDPYRGDWDEFQPDGTDWNGKCKNLPGEVKLANDQTRSEWKTIESFYPLRSPKAFQENPGPAILPLAITHIEEVVPPSDMSEHNQPLQAPIIILKGALPDTPVQAFLLPKGDRRIIDLGGPIGDSVLARGAYEGDRICVFNRLSDSVKDNRLTRERVVRLGCETLSYSNQDLNLTEYRNWPPQLLITAVSSTTLNVTATLTGLDQSLPIDLTARLYPSHGEPITTTFTHEREQYLQHNL